MTWVDTLLAFTTADGAQTIISLLSTMDPDERRGATVTRIIGCLTVLSAVEGVVNGGMNVDYGIGVASQEAFSTGAVSDPTDPAAAPLRGWLYCCRQATSSFTETGHADSEVRWMFDVRSQRKLDTGELFMVIEPNDFRGTAFSISTLGSIRVLLKLA